MARTKKAQDDYIGRSGETVQIDSATYNVTVHWAQVAGQAVPVGIDLRSFTTSPHCRDCGSRKIDHREQPTDGWTEVTGRTMRGLKVAEQVEVSRQDLRTLLLQALAAVDDGPSIQQALEAPQDRRRPGPPSTFSDDLLREVARAHRAAAPKRKTEAVREVLAQYRKHVTTDEAKYATKRARAAGLLGNDDRSAR